MVDEPRDGAPDAIAARLGLGAVGALPVLRRAAANAPSATALELLDTVLHLMPPDDPERAEVLAARARVLLSLGEADASAAAAAALVPSAANLELQLRLHVTEVLARLARGESAEPVPPISEWLRRAGIAPGTLTAADALALAEYALVEMITGHPRAATATLDLVAGLDDRPGTGSGTGAGNGNGNGNGNGHGHGYESASASASENEGANENENESANESANDDSTAASADGGEVLSILVRTARAVTALYAGAIDEAAHHAEWVQAAVARSSRIAELAGYVPLVGCGVVLARAGRPDDGLAALASGRQMLHAFGLVWMESMCDANVAMVLFDAGQWDDALAVVDGGLAGGADHAQLAYQPWLLAIRALILARRGDLAAAEVACAAAERGHPAVFNGLDHVRWARATIDSARGDEPGRQLALDALTAAVLESGEETLPSTMGLDVVRAHLDAGRLDAARQAASRLPDGAAVPVVAALAAAGRALVAGEAHRLADAAAVVAPVLPYDAGRLWEDAAVAAAARGQAVGDRAARAAQAYRSLGAQTDLARLRQRVPVAGLAAEPAPRAHDGLDALTRTERRVTWLVAEGRSNVEIAEQLSVSRRTVESHLARVFTKVGVRSRLQLAVLARADRSTAN